MTLYFAVGASVAMARLLMEQAGMIHPTRQDSTWVLAVAMTDVLWWPLVVAVLLLQRATRSLTTS